MVFLLAEHQGKKIIKERFNKTGKKFEIKEFDDLITYLIISLIIGGRLGYVVFYNFQYYISNPLDIFKIWEGGMSFHGGLLGIIFGTYLFSVKRNLQTLFFLDIIACISQLEFFGRIANFINGELVGKITNVPWSVVFPLVDSSPRHPSQIYEAILEGLLLYFILKYIISQDNYKLGTCSYMFLILYGFFKLYQNFLENRIYI